MHHLLVLTIVGCLAVSTSGFLLSPSIYNVPHANHTICQSDSIDESNYPSSLNRIPYFSCVNDGHLTIFSCRTELSNAHTCPLNFPGTVGSKGFPNSPVVLHSGDKLINQDCTSQLKELCDGKTDCNFCWNMLPSMSAVGMKSYDFTKINPADQNMVVEFTCSNKRNSFRPFSNKRFHRNFHPTLQHPLRKLSYNRLQQL